MRPVRRRSRATKWQVTLHTPAALSTGFRLREAARPAYAERGATAHHPTGMPSRYAMSPGSAPERTQPRSSAFRSAG